MKYTKKRIVKFLLAAFALISAFGAAMTVNAAAPKLSAKKVTCYVGGSNGLNLKGNVEKLQYGKVHFEVKYSQKKVAAVNITHGGKNDKCIVVISGLKKGKTTATITVWYGNNQKKDLKLVIDVKKLSQKPFKSFKIGETDFASKIKKSRYAGYDYDCSGELGLNRKLTVSITPQKGWKISEIHGMNSNNDQKIKNGQQIDTSKNYGIYVNFENIKTKTIMNVQMIW